MPAADRIVEEKHELAVELNGRQGAGVEFWTLSRRELVQLVGCRWLTRTYSNIGQR